MKNAKNASEYAVVQKTLLYAVEADLHRRSNETIHVI